MKKIRILNICFANEIKAWEVPALRSAVIETAGRENILFHNHLNDKFRYAYPLIQYKRISRKPHIICFEKGVDEVHHFFENRKEDLKLNNHTYKVEIEKININNFTLQIWNKQFDYFIQEWLPFNQENYKKFHLIGTELDQFDFLEGILKGNILSFAKGVGWEVDKEIKLRIKNVIRTNTYPVKGVRRESYSLNFSSNVYLPQYIGLGKNSSLGFGVVRELKEKKMENNE